MSSPKLAIGDGALGFWPAVDQIYPGTRQQRCWVHKTANMLNKLPKSSQLKAKQGLHDIWMAETRTEAVKAFDLFIETCQDKYPKVAQSLLKDQHELLTFYDFPAKHWQSIRTTNPIESTFATIRHRTKRSKGCLSRDTMLHMMLKVGLCAEKRWRRSEALTTWLRSSPESNSTTALKCRRSIRKSLDSTAWTPDLTIARLRCLEGSACSKDLKRLTM